MPSVVLSQRQQAEGLLPNNIVQGGALVDMYAKCSMGCLHGMLSLETYTYMLNAFAA